MTEIESTKPESQAGRKSAKTDCAILLVLWLLMLACAMPHGDFPLNDDWNYARSVKALLDEHRLMITHWSLAASIPHIFFGWIACLFGGFSFTALRAVSSIGGFAAGLVVYFLSLRCGAQRGLALLAAILWLTNPLVFNSANTFMTDLTFMMLGSGAIMYMSRMLQREQLTWRSSLVASLLCVLACLTRQTGIVIPIAFLLVSKFNRKALPPVLFAGVSIWAFEHWLMATMGPLQSYRVEQAWIQGILARGPLYVMSNMMSSLLCSFVYFGVFLFPLFVATYPRMLSTLTGKPRRNALILLVEPIVLIAIGILLTHSLMPLSDNVIFNLGLGPILLGGTSKQLYATAPQWFWIIVTACGVIGAGLGASTMLTVCTRKPPRPVVFLVTIFWLYIAVICFRGYFDRYLMFPLFLLLPMVASSYSALEAPAPADSPVESRRFRVLTPVAYLLIILYATFSVAGTHDYFAWNRAKWQAAHDLVEVNHISPMEIDGGLEFNGWWGYDPQFRDSGGITFAGDMRHGNEYIIAMTWLPGYEVISRYSFQRWLPSGGGEIMVLRKVH